MASANQKDVLTAFLDLTVGGRRASTGWINMNCPSCGDTRSRFGLMVTGTGGFRARCFNAGCDFNTSATGWEPGGGLGGRPRKLFEALGGDVRDLPMETLFRRSDTFDRNGNAVVKGETAAFRFDEVQLPPGSVLLADANPQSDDEEQGLYGAFNYVLDVLGEEIAEATAFHWSPKHPNHVIIPYMHHGRVVGWLGRKTAPGHRDRFIGSAPADYMYRQDTLERTDARAAIVMEGVQDADAIRGVAVRGAKVTKKQELLLNICGQRIITLPDWSKDGEGLIDDAERNGWLVSVPDWDPDVKDATQAVKRYGRLYAIQSVVSVASPNYLKARAAVRLRGKDSR